MSKDINVVLNDILQEDPALFNKIAWNMGEHQHCQFEWKGKRLTLNVDPDAPDKIEEAEGE